MASITIPTPVEINGGTLAGYIYNSDNTNIQALFDSDTDWTSDGSFLKYKNMPVLMTTSSSDKIGIMYPLEKRITADRGSTNTYYSIFHSGSDGYYMYIYNFENFVLLCTNFSATSAIYNSSGQVMPYNYNQYVIAIDKVNLEIIIPTLSSKRGYTVICAGFNKYSQNSQYPMSLSSYPCDYGYNTHVEDANAVLRTQSVSEVEYFNIYNSKGDVATNFKFLRTFPSGSSNQVLHVDNKYFYVFPYPEYQTSNTFDTGGVAQEVWCAVAIDVTSEINAQP